MSSVLIQGKLTTPLGKAIPQAGIRFTSLSSVNEVAVNSEGIIETNTTGDYAGEVAYGTYKLEVNADGSEYVWIGNVVINSSTPNPISLNDLPVFGAPLSAPVVTPDSTNWEELHLAVRESVDTYKGTQRVQVRDGDTVAASIQEIFIDDVTDSDIAESASVAQVSGVKAESVNVAYKDAALNESSTVSEVMATQGGSQTKEASITQTSNGIAKLKSKATTQLGTTAEVSSLSFSQYGRKVEHTLSVAGVTVNAKDEVGNESTQQVHTTSIGGVDRLYTYNQMSDYETDLLTIQNFKAGVTQGKLTHNVSMYQQDENAVVVNMLYSAKVNSNNAGISYSVGVDKADMLLTADTFKLKQTDRSPLIEADTLAGTFKINGKLTVGNPADFKGDTGDSRIQEYQYSVDNLTWHTEFALDDMWRRQRDVINGSVGVWSQGYLLQAIDGAPGDSEWVEYQYRSTSAEAWHTTMVSGDIWRRERMWTNGVPSGSWSTAARIMGYDGAEGAITNMEYQYAPLATSGEAIWHSNFITGDHFRRERLLVYIDLAAFEAGTPIDPFVPWNSVTQIVPINGVDYGIKQTTVYLYKRSTTVPTGPSGTLTYNFMDLTLTPSANLNGWSQKIPDGTAPIYIAVAVASTLTEDDDILVGEWNISAWSTSGSTLAVANLFCLADTLPAVEFTVANQELSTGIITIVGTNTQGWQGTPPNNDLPGGTVWLITNAQLEAAGSTLVPHLAEDFSAPVVFSKNAVGTPGKHGQGSFRMYRTTVPNDTVKDSDVASIAQRPAEDGDLINYFKDDGTSSSQFSRYFFRESGSWVETANIVNGSSVIDGTLAAQKLMAATITGDKISAATTITAGSGATTAGMNGATGTGTDLDDISFWAGAPKETPKAGKFYVERNGDAHAKDMHIENLVAVDAQVSGKITSSEYTGGIISGSTIVGGVIVGATVYASYLYIPTDTGNDGSSSPDTLDYYVGHGLHDEVPIPVGANENVNLSLRESLVSKEVIVFNFSGLTCARDNRLPTTQGRCAYNRIPASTFSYDTVPFGVSDTDTFNITISTIDRATGNVLSSTVGKIYAFETYGQTTIITHYGLDFEFYTYGNQGKFTMRNLEGIYGQANTPNSWGYIRISIDVLNKIPGGAITTASAIVDNTAPIPQ